MLNASFPLSHMSSLCAVKLIDISLEEYLVNGLCLPLLAKVCQTWDRVGNPVLAKVCKLLQNFAIANT